MAHDAPDLSQLLGLAHGEDTPLFSKEDEAFLQEFQADPLWNRIQDVLIAIYQAEALTDICRYADNKEKVLAAAGGLAMVQRLLREMPQRMLQYRKQLQRGTEPRATDVTGTAKPGPGRYEPPMT